MCLAVGVFDPVVDLTDIMDQHRCLSLSFSRRDILIAVQSSVMEFDAAISTVLAGLKPRHPMDGRQDFPLMLPMHLIR